MKKIIVVKLGSSILMTKREKLDEFRIAHIADQALSLQESGFGVILVVSGAVACGHKFIDFSSDQRCLRQAAAGLGQAVLTSTFVNIFSQKKMHIAQILLTKNNLDSVSERQKTKELLEFYIQLGIIPVINENDVMDLNSFGGNDLLAAEIGKLIDAEKVFILSTMEGSVHGIGGAATKHQAIKILAKENIETKIVNGKEKDVLLKLL